MKIKTLFFLLLLVFSPLFSTDKMKFTTVKNSAIKNITHEVMKEAYKRLGIDITVIPLPAKRALHMSNSDTKYDGELHRIKGIEVQYPNLVPIPVPIFFSEAVVVTLKSFDLKVNGWQSLKPHYIGIKRGIVLAENGTYGMNRVILNSYEKLFEMLKAKRVDVLVMTRLSALKSLKKQKKSKFKIGDKPLQVYTMHHYVHKKNAHLVPKLTSVLKLMEQEGIIQKIKEDYILENFK